MRKRETANSKNHSSTKITASELPHIPKLHWWTRKI